MANICSVFSKILPLLESINATKNNAYFIHTVVGIMMKSGFRFAALTAAAVALATSASASFDLSGKPSKPQETPECTKATEQLGAAIGGILNAAKDSLMEKGPTREEADQRFIDAQAARKAAADAVAVHCPPQ